MLVEYLRKQRRDSNVALAPDDEEEAEEPQEKRETDEIVDTVWLNCLHVDDRKPHPVTYIQEVGGGPLHIAAYQGMIRVVRLLVYFNADILGRDTAQRTPLHHGAYGGHSNVCRFLLERGADPEAVDAAGRTPLLLASGEWPPCDTADYLVEAPATPNDSTPSTPTVSKKSGPQDLSELITKSHSKLASHNLVVTGDDTKPADHSTCEAPHADAVLEALLVRAASVDLDRRHNLKANRKTGAPARVATALGEACVAGRIVAVKATNLTVTEVNTAHRSYMRALTNLAVCSGLLRFQLECVDSFDAADVDLLLKLVQENKLHQIPREVTFELVHILGVQDRPDPLEYLYMVLRQTLPSS